MPPRAPFVTGLLFTSRTKTHSGAKIQNGYKILSIDTYYKGKLAYPHFRYIGNEITYRATLKLVINSFQTNTIAERQEQASYAQLFCHA